MVEENIEEGNKKPKQLIRFRKIMEYLYNHKQENEREIVDDVFHIAVRCGNCNHQEILQSCFVYTNVESPNSVRVGHKLVVSDRLICPKCSSGLIIFNEDYWTNNLGVFL